MLLKDPLVSETHPTYAKSLKMMESIVPYGKLRVLAAIETIEGLMFEKMTRATANVINEVIGRRDAIQFETHIQAHGDTKTSMCVLPVKDGSNQWEYFTSNEDLLSILGGSSLNVTNLELGCNKEMLAEGQWNAVRLQINEAGYWFPAGLKVIKESELKELKPYWHYWLLAYYLLKPLRNNVVEWQMKQGKRCRVSLQPKYLRSSEQYGHGYINPRLVRVVNVKTGEPIVIDMLSVVRTLPIV